MNKSQGEAGNFDGVASKILEGANCSKEDIFEDYDSLPNLKKIDLRTSGFSQVNGNGFGDRCNIYMPISLSNKVLNGEVRLNIKRMGPKAIVDDLNIIMYDFTGSVTALIGSSGDILMGNLGLVNFDFRIGHGGTVIVGDKTTSNGTRVIGVNSQITIQRDVMMSDEILIQGFDQHGILDLNSGEMINLDRNSVVIGRHVWLGRRSTIMPGAVIGDGSIVGAGSLVTSEVPSCSVTAGVPAKVRRTNVSWSRSWLAIDTDTDRFLEDVNAPFKMVD